VIARQDGSKRLPAVLSSEPNLNTPFGLPVRLRFLIVRRIAFRALPMCTVGLRINAVHVASFDEREAMTSQPPPRGAGEQVVLAAERDRTD
jgi:hypothetical protein